MAEVAPLAVGIPFATAALLAAMKPWRTADDLIASSAAGVTALFCVAHVDRCDRLRWPGGLLPRDWRPLRGGAVIGVTTASIRSALACHTRGDAGRDGASLHLRYFDTEGPSFQALLLVLPRRPGGFRAFRGTLSTCSSSSR
jgi:hypothetical protein